MKALKQHHVVTALFTCDLISESPVSMLKGGLILCALGIASPGFGLPAPKEGKRPPGFTVLPQMGIQRPQLSPPPAQLQGALQLGPPYSPFPVLPYYQYYAPYPFHPIAPQHPYFGNGMNKPEVNDIFGTKPHHQGEPKKPRHHKSKNLPEKLVRKPKPIPNSSPSTESYNKSDENPIRKAHARPENHSQKEGDGGSLEENDSISSGESNKDHNIIRSGIPKTAPVHQMESIHEPQKSESVEVSTKNHKSTSDEDSSEESKGKSKSESDEHSSGILKKSQRDIREEVSLPTASDVSFNSEISSEEQNSESEDYSSEGSAEDTKSESDEDSSEGSKDKSKSESDDYSSEDSKDKSKSEPDDYSSEDSKDKSKSDSDDYSSEDSKDKSKLGSDDYSSEDSKDKSKSEPDDYKSNDYDYDSSLESNEKSKSESDEDNSHESYDESTSESDGDSSGILKKSGRDIREEVSWPIASDQEKNSERSSEETKSELQEDISEGTKEKSHGYSGEQVKEQIAPDQSSKEDSDYRDERNASREGSRSSEGSEEANFTEATTSRILTSQHDTMKPNKTSDASSGENSDANPTSKNSNAIQNQTGPSYDTSPIKILAKKMKPNSMKLPTLLVWIIDQMDKSLIGRAVLFGLIRLYVHIVEVGQNFIDSVHLVWDRLSTEPATPGNEERKILTILDNIMPENMGKYSKHH